MAAHDLDQPRMPCLAANGLPWIHGFMSLAPSMMMTRSSGACVTSASAACARRCGRRREMIVEGRRAAVQPFGDDATPPPSSACSTLGQRSSNAWREDRRRRSPRSASRRSRGWFSCDLRTTLRLAEGPGGVDAASRGDRQSDDQPLDRRIAGCDSRLHAGRFSRSSMTLRRRLEWSVEFDNQPMRGNRNRRHMTDGPACGSASGTAKSPRMCSIAPSASVIARQATSIGPCDGA